MEIAEINKTYIRNVYKNTAISCVQSILQYYNLSVSQDEIKGKLFFDEEGNTSFADIASAFESFGLIAEGFRAESISNLDELSNPAIIYVFLENGSKDFAVYYRKCAEKYLIGMPFWGLNLYTAWELESIWDDHILLKVQKRHGTE